MASSVGSHKGRAFGHLCLLDVVVCGHMVVQGFCTERVPTRGWVDGLTGHSHAVFPCRSAIVHSTPDKQMQELCYLPPMF